jgi:hypothetical protein
MPSPLTHPGAVHPNRPFRPKICAPQRGHFGHNGRRILLAAAALGVAACAGATSASAAVASTTTTTVAAVPSIINNGSFALKGAPAGWTQVNLQEPPYKAPYPLEGWVVGGAGGYGVEAVSSKYFSAPPGSTQSLVLNEQGLGSVAQTLKTTPGWAYRVTWYGSGEPGPEVPRSSSMHVVWDKAVVAAPSYKSSALSSANPVWVPQHAVVTATSASSILEFAGASNFPMVGEASVAADAALYLPPTATLAPTGKLVAVVRMPSGPALTDRSLTVSLYGTWKTVSYAPASTQLIASGTVLNGQAVLKLHLPASLAHKTIPAYATLSGKGFLSVTDHLKIKVS